MAARPAFPSLLLFLLISAVDLVSSDIAPSPVPGGPVRAPAPSTPLPASAMAPFHSSPAPAMGPSAPSPAFSPGSSESPPAPPVASASSPSLTLSPAPTPTPTPMPTPTPGPSAVNEVVADGKKSDEQAVVGDSSGGMSGGKKVGIAVGVLTAAAVVGLGALVYKKRRENIQRSRYGYATRRDML